VYGYNPHLKSPGRVIGKEFWDIITLVLDPATGERLPLTDDILPKIAKIMRLDVKTMYSGLPLELQNQWFGVKEPHKIITHVWGLHVEDKVSTYPIIMSKPVCPWSYAMTPYWRSLLGL